jgi:UDP-N-acetylmuramoyl-tripeptide--D-alanyl-D-alanine ligase
MRAMLNSFANQQYKNKLCILGDMLELGEESIKEHIHIIKLTNELKLDCIFVGEIFNSLNENGFKTRVELAEKINSKKIYDKTILLKGSRGIELEKLIEFL